MANLITAAEVISKAFDRDIESTKIKDNVILGAQLKHIMPVLGEDFYDLVIATPSSYSDLVDKIKPPLAYFVKYYVLPILKIETGTVGMAQITGQNRNAPTDQDQDDQLKNTLDNANMLIDELSKYLDDNQSLYPDYDKYLNNAEHITIAGGIIFQKPVYDEDDED